MIIQVAGHLAPFPIKMCETEGGQNNGCNRYQRKNKAQLKTSVDICHIL
jgi:hypothetical protein